MGTTKKENLILSFMRDVQAYYVNAYDVEKVHKEINSKSFYAIMASLEKKGYVSRQYRNENTNGRTYSVFEGFKLTTGG